MGPQLPSEIPPTFQSIAKWFWRCQQAVAIAVYYSEPWLCQGNSALALLCCICVYESTLNSFGFTVLSDINSLRPYSHEPELSRFIWNETLVWGLLHDCVHRIRIYRLHINIDSSSFFQSSGLCYFFTPCGENDSTDIYPAKNVLVFC